MFGLREKKPETEVESKEERNQFRISWVVVCVILALICLGIAGFQIYHFYRQEVESEGKMEALRIQLEMEESLAAERAKLESIEQKEQNSLEKALVENPYAELFLQNPDMAAWLVIEGTKIDYPVMHTPQEENYYLYRDFYGNEDKAGCLLLDVESSLYGDVTTNQIIHGHNMKAGTMFGELDRYKEAEYAKEHNLIRLFGKDKEHRYEVIAAFYTQVYLTTDVTFKYYNFFQANTKEEFQYFYDNIKKLSLYDTGIEAEFGDRFLTLSTCSYQVEDGRFVVVAKEVEPGDSYKSIEE